MIAQQPDDDRVDGSDEVEPEAESGAGYGNHAPEPGLSEPHTDET